MKALKQKSTIIILSFLAFTSLICLYAYKPLRHEGFGEDNQSVLKETPTVMEGIAFYHTRGSLPYMNMFANKLESFGEEYVLFYNPNGEAYQYEEPNQIKKINYRSLQAEYLKAKDRLNLMRYVLIESEGSTFSADLMSYLFKKKLLIGKGEVEVIMLDPKKGTTVKINSPTMRAYPFLKQASFKPQVSGQIKEKSPMVQPITFSAGVLDFNGQEGTIRFNGGVLMQKGDIDVSARKGDIYLENRNKKLKYLLFNDDVKLKEKLKLKDGSEIVRRGFSERMEGYGREEMLILSGAPRVEQGKDVIKGYRITLREKMEFIEVEDAMSDLSTEKKKK